MKKRLVVLSGAGMSAESGLATFRGNGGLWEGRDVREVASLEGWRANPQLVLSFYNERRSQEAMAEPNDGHRVLAELETFFEVQIVTQNVDTLHERAGSNHVLHLHGRLDEMRSERNPNLILPYQQPIGLGDVAPDGAQLRPNIVWFGEEVPLYAKAVELVRKADLLVIVGTSLQVYPAAGLIHEVPAHNLVYIIDPEPPRALPSRCQILKEGATAGLQKLSRILHDIVD